MRRIDLINSIQKVANAIQRANVHDILIFAANEKVNPEGILSSYQVYNEHYKSFGENEKKILEIFGLTGLEHVKFWTKILTSEKGEVRDLAQHYRRGIIYLLDYTPKFTTLLKQNNFNYDKIDDKEIQGKANNSNKSILTVILPENDTEQSSPERLIKTLESINLLYSSFAVLENHTDSDLSVVAIDSGSDKSFDFLGAAKLMDATRELILGLWDRVVFFREKKLSEKLDLISKSLPIMEKIVSLEQKQAISREQAEILKRNISTATNNFIKAGAIIPEFGQHLLQDPRALMAPEQKLLANSISESNVGQVVSDNEEEIETDDLSENDIKEIKKLLEKKKKNGKPLNKNGKDNIIE